MECLNGMEQTLLRVLPPLLRGLSQRLQEGGGGGVQEPLRAPAQLDLPLGRQDLEQGTELVVGDGCVAHGQAAEGLHQFA
ncbi:hypothetical protein D3C80_2158140 [compost metagenome]